MKKFTTSWYDQVIKEYGYDPIGFASVNHRLGDMPPEMVGQLWLCEYAFACSMDISKTLYTTGIGLSGVPHMGTISQILRTIMLQRYGCNVQIVLGDIDAYTGRGELWDSTQELKDQYDQFILNMGFMSDRGILRAQADNSNVFRAQSKIAKYFEDSTAERSEEDLHQFYVDHAKVEDDMTFRRKYSLALMCSDFIDPLIDGNYKHVVVFLGVDEHRYVYVARKILRDMSVEFSVLKGKTISALYSPIIQGFNGFPKMSKSFPESSLSLMDTMDVIRKRIMEHEEKSEDPRNDVVFQLMTPFLGYYSIDEQVLLDHYFYQRDRWIEDKQALVEAIAEAKKAWNND